MVERNGSLFTPQDLWRPAYAVWHGSRSLLARGSNIISSSSARSAVKCPAKKCTAAEYQQNPLTFSPTTAVLIRATAQKGGLSLTLEPLSPLSLPCVGSVDRFYYIFQRYREVFSNFQQQLHDLALFDKNSEDEP